MAISHKRKTDADKRAFVQNYDDKMLAGASPDDIAKAEGTTTGSLQTRVSLYRKSLGMPPLLQRKPAAEPMFSNEPSEMETKPEIAAAANAPAYTASPETEAKTPPDVTITAGQMPPEEKPATVIMPDDKVIDIDAIKVEGGVNAPPVALDAKGKSADTGTYAMATFGKREKWEMAASLAGNLTIIEKAVIDSITPTKPMNDDEKKVISDSMARVLYFYLPDALSPKQAALLWFLMLQGGLILSRQKEIAAAIEQGKKDDAAKKAGTAATAVNPTVTPGNEAKGTG